MTPVLGDRQSEVVTAHSDCALPPSERKAALAADASQLCHFSDVATTTRQLGFVNAAPFIRPIIMSARRRR